LPPGGPPRLLSRAWRPKRRHSLTEQYAVESHFFGLWNNSNTQTQYWIGLREQADNSANWYT
jgi:hypothetical protein